MKRIVRDGNSTTSTVIPIRLSHSLTKKELLSALHLASVVKTLIAPLFRIVPTTEFSGDPLDGIGLPLCT